MTVRLLVAALLLLATGGYLSYADTTEPVATRTPLSACPMTIADWQGRPAADLDERTLSVLRVDEYINRFYRSPDGGIVGLYVGFYGSQRTGDTIHSPLNCLPGSGWSPLKKDRINVGVNDRPTDDRGRPARTIEINRYVIEKGLDRQLVLYWYQSHGRVVASEYWGKIYLVMDAIRTNKTDGALVRIVTPIVSTEEAAEREAVDFVRQLFPLLFRHLPA